MYKIEQVILQDLFLGKKLINYFLSCQKVRSVSVNECDEPPEKWVKLKSKYEYNLKINISLDQKELPAVDKENCAELQHISQPESEVDNNEEDDD